MRRIVQSVDGNELGKRIIRVHGVHPFAVGRGGYERLKGLLNLRHHPFDREDEFLSWALVTACYKQLKCQTKAVGSWLPIAETIRNGW